MIRVKWNYWLEMEKIACKYHNTIVNHVTKWFNCVIIVTNCQSILPEDF